MPPADLSARHPSRSRTSALPDQLGLFDSHQENSASDPDCAPIPAAPAIPRSEIPEAQPVQDTESTTRPATVTELTRRIRELLEGEVGDVWVEGEISNYRRQQSGHQYFTLKDERAQIACVLFAGGAAARVRIADGDHVRLFGKVTVYEQRGQYQINVRRIELFGAGLLQARFEELKRKLAAEGLFDASKKRPLPAVPRAIGLVTSPTGAALRDMLQILERRAPYVKLYLCPVRVQGEGAADEIADAIGRFSDPVRSGFPKVDLLIVGRGGGSIEDLWAFNEEAVARAIAACTLPVISAVGHEIDFTIADFVADCRAPTPSAAAELAAPDRAELLATLGRIAFVVRRETSRQIDAAATRLRAIRSGAGLREPARRIAEGAQAADRLAELARLQLRARFATLSDRLASAAGALNHLKPEEVLRRHRERLATLAALVAQNAGRAMADRAAALRALGDQIRLLGPQNTLERGYSITRLAGSERILRDPAEVPPGSRVETLLARGRLLSETR